jgi:glycosyltransferase involved in cell wall biosynthesis
LSKLLTIYIPTYNRKKEVLLLLNEIISSDLMHVVKIFVADDGSDDGTYEKLISKYSEEKITIIRHSPNVGISAGYLHFIELCDTDYFMIMADDDTIREEGVMDLISFLKDEKPYCVSTAWSSIDCNGIWMEPSRYKKGNPIIKLKDIRGATNHSPGVVFCTSVALKYVHIMKERLGNKCYATTMYPVAVLALFIASSNNNCRWFSEVVGGYRASGALSSNLVDNDGNTWNSFVGRWKEQESFTDIYKYIYTISDDKIKPMILQLLELHKLHFYYRIEEALKSNDDDLLQYFLMTSSARSLKKILTSVKMFFQYVSKIFIFMWRMR